MRSAAAAAVRANELAAVRAELLELRARVQALERGRGPRDDADRALVLALADAAAGLPFKAGMVFRRAVAVPALADALRNADVDNEKQLGKLLDRVKGSPIEGVVVARTGRFWVCRVVM
jgi:hypothetical protein